jgi:hypothetical protein
LVFTQSVDRFTLTSLSHCQAIHNPDSPLLPSFIPTADACSTPLECVNPSSFVSSARRHGSRWSPPRSSDRPPRIPFARLLHLSPPSLSEPAAHLPSTPFSPPSRGVLPSTLSRVGCAGRTARGPFSSPISREFPESDYAGKTKARERRTSTISSTVATDYSRSGTHASSSPCRLLYCIDFAQVNAVDRVS